MTTASRRNLALVMSQRLWQGAAGLVTVILVTRLLSLEQQGWYYSFLSLAAVYTLFDLGLSLVLVQTAAHYSLDLSWQQGGVTGPDSARFLVLASSSFRRYLWLALGFAILVVPLGWLMFAGHPDALPGWQAQWTAIGLATAVSLLPMPFLAVVEGSGDVGAVYLVRLAQGIVGAIATWLALSLGWGLWAALMGPLAAALVPLGWLLARRIRLLRAALAQPGAALAWGEEIWPLQWRVGLSWLSGYLLTQIQTLVLLQARGAEEAGRMGLSLALGNMLGLVAMSFVTRHVPVMAKAAAARDWPLLDTLFRRDFLASSALFLAGALVLVAGHLALSGTDIVTRVLPFWPFCGLLLALFATHVTGALAAQLRSYRQEPLVWIAAAGAAATLILATAAAFAWGASGVVAALVAIQVLLVLPASAILWRRRNRELRAAA